MIEYTESSQLRPDVASIGRYRGPMGPPEISWGSVKDITGEITMEIGRIERFRFITAEPYRVRKKTLRNFYRRPGLTFRRLRKIIRMLQRYAVKRTLIAGTGVYTIGGTK